MKELEQSQYFERRAEEERSAAARANDERAAPSHRDLAQRYERKARDEVECDSGSQEAVSASSLSEGFKIIP